MFVMVADLASKQAAKPLAEFRLLALLALLSISFSSPMRRLCKAGAELPGSIRLARIGNGIDWAAVASHLGSLKLLPP